ncbi:MAG: hypothetical protein ABEH77_09355 [Halobacteriaceae archaeon]
MVDVFDTEEGEVAPAVVIATALVVAALAAGILYQLVLFLL